MKLQNIWILYIIKFNLILMDSEDLLMDSENKSDLSEKKENEEESE